MNLYVCGKFDLPHIDLGDFTHMISIQNSDVSGVECRPSTVPETSYLMLAFSDVVDPNHADAPNRPEMEKLFTWMKRQCDVGALLVHCDAGLRRSPAVALFCLTHFESVPYEESMKTVEENSSCRYIWPNDLIVEIGDDLASAGGGALRAVEVWKADHTDPI